jgi:hypothetical protein
LATFDGEVLRLEEKLPIDPNTQVRITIDLPGDPPGTVSFLETALAQTLEGPPDWSERLDDYLYGTGELPHE